MLKAYIRRWKERCADVLEGAISGNAPTREWLESALAGFVALDGNREAMTASFAARPHSRLSRRDPRARVDGTHGAVRLDPVRPERCPREARTIQQRGRLEAN